MRIWLIILTVVGVISTSEGHARHSKIQTKLGPATKKTKEHVCNLAQVELSVSCQLTEFTSRRLLVSWWVPDVYPADMIALYVTDPAVNFTSPVFTFSPSTSTGWSHTPLQEKYLDYGDIFTPVCLGYWVVYWRGHSKIATSCLQTNPSWMSDHREALGRLRLTELFIPGSHDSGAYFVNYHPREETRYEKYVYTQEESVLTQLLHGVRYLDLRLGYHKKSGGFYAHHGVAKLRHFQGIIDDVIVFLNNSQDIVIMDLHHFPVGFKNVDTHHELIRYLENELSEYMATPALSWQASLEDVWRTGRRLIVSYNNNVIVTKRMHKLWYPVVHKWGDVRTVEELQSYLQTLMKRHVVEAWAAMAELTPNKWDVLLDSKGGLRAMAADTNLLVTDWFRKDWGGQCNIVAVDFVRSSGIVSTAIRWNLLKAFDFC